jgi:hypothetical protein
MTDKVIQAIDSERDYQNRKWGNSLSGGRPGKGERSVDEFALYIIAYADDLLKYAGHYASDTDKLEIIRKITSLGVHCMEQHGAPLRVDKPMNQDGLTKP